MPSRLFRLSPDCQLFVHAASEVRSILEDDAASVSKESDNYWVLTAALKRYVDNEGKGQLPIEVCMPPKLCTPGVVYCGVCRAVVRGACSQCLVSSVLYRGVHAPKLLQSQHHSFFMLCILHPLLMQSSVLQLPVEGVVTVLTGWLLQS